MNELKALTGARGLAAWWVVLFHLRGSMAEMHPAIESAIAKGYLAVDFFFLLSGFVIWLSWGRRFGEGGLPVAGRFLWKRMARIWPLHLFVLGCAVALAIVLAATGRNIDRFPFAELPLHIVLLQSWGFTDPLKWNDPAWSISAESAAYLLFPLLAMAVDWRRVPSVVLVAFVALLLFGLLPLCGQDGLGSELQRFAVARCVIQFAAGTAIGALWLRWQGRDIVAVSAGILALGLAAAWGTKLLSEAHSLPAALACLLLAAGITSNRRGNPLEWWPIYRLGEISYATYLGHFLLWFVFKLVLVEDATDAPLWVLALYVVAVIASSEVLYRGVERPAQNWLNRVGDRRRLAVA
ncbi:acyltransferase [uncultured Sphingomonas sp.]|uniref:acyltransferase family protein n=1 Tax=uncultured Sphingomonas sp. TaxID=158754 RepID=UPI0025E3BB49|nr:acyltransferase [uncultured Sphingomonas sp.]